MNVLKIIIEVSEVGQNEGAKSQFKELDLDDIPIQPLIAINEKFVIEKDLFEYVVTIPNRGSLMPEYSLFGN